MKDEDVARFLDSLPAEAWEIVSALRKVIRRTVPAAKESVLWGGLSYHRPAIGGRVKGAVCQIGVKAGKVHVAFIHGVRLTDPYNLLQGDRLSKRFVTINTVTDAEQPELLELLREAGSRDPSEWV
jgi:hypothetical protein